jgi:glycosyltransferase involved in cell wall biosynthesis
MPLSVVILSFKSAATLPQTLTSLAGVSDDIHVVDSFSTDGTPQIARDAGARVVQRAFERYDLQRNWAIANLPLRHGWELHLDADERLTPELGRAIATILAAPPAEFDGFMIPRLTYFLGGPIRHGGMYPNWHLRLFRRGRGRCERRLYDQHFLVEGRAGRIDHPVIDDVCMPLGEWVRRHARWAEAQVEIAMHPTGRGEIAGRWRGSPIERKRWLRDLYGRFPLFVRPFLLFLYRYIIRLGFLDGRPELVFFVLQTFWFHFLVDAEIFERRLRGAGPHR